MMKKRFFKVISVTLAAILLLMPFSVCAFADEMPERVSTCVWYKDEIDYVVIMVFIDGKYVSPGQGLGFTVTEGEKLTQVTADNYIITYACEETFNETEICIRYYYTRTGNYTPDMKVTVKENSFLTADGTGNPELVCDAGGEYEQSQRMSYEIKYYSISGEDTKDDMICDGCSVSFAKHTSNGLNRPKLDERVRFYINGVEVPPTPDEKYVIEGETVIQVKVNDFICDTYEFDLKTPREMYFPHLARSFFFMLLSPLMALFGIATLAVPIPGIWAISLASMVAPAGALKVFFRALFGVDYPLF